MAVLMKQVIDPVMIVEIPELGLSFPIEGFEIEDDLGGDRRITLRTNLGTNFLQQGNSYPGPFEHIGYSEVGWMINTPETELERVLDFFNNLHILFQGCDCFTCQEVWR